MKNVSWFLISILLHGVIGAGLLYSADNLDSSPPPEEILDLTLASPTHNHFENKPATAPPAAKRPAAPTISTEAPANTPASAVVETSPQEADGDPSGGENSESSAPVAWGEVTRLPKVMREVKATYPLEAKKAGIAGPVVLDILVDSVGKVRDIHVVSGPGFGLNESAVEALRKFEFRPALKGANSVAVKIRYTYRFKLDVN